MKKLIVGALIALLTLLVLTGAASAASTDAINVTGNVIAGYIDVSVTNDVTFGTMTPGMNTIPNTTVLGVTTTLPSWAVTAADQNTGAVTKGYMRMGINKLSNYFLINMTSRPDHDISNPYEILQGTVPTATANIGFKQKVVDTDAPGAYTITVVFTGAAD
jgi:hypothetical protein